MFLRIQYDALWSKEKNLPNLTPVITFRLVICIPFIRFGQAYKFIFLFFLKIQDGGPWSKVKNRLNLPSQISFRRGIWFPFMRFGQNGRTV